MNFTTRVITKADYLSLVNAIKNGYGSYHAKPRVAFAIYLQVNLGLRIGDVLQLRRSNFSLNGNEIRLNLIEQKTSKKRNFPVNPEVFSNLLDYCNTYNLSKMELLFDFTYGCLTYNIRQFAKRLNIHGISTHSFRKLFATTCYEMSDHDIVFVQKIMQHSSTSCTQRYIGIDEEKIADILKKLTFA